MLALGAFTLESNDMTGLSPHRPAGPGRRSQGGVSHLNRSFQRAVARAMDEATRHAAMPRVSNYQY
jgi:hypothetical protein